MNKHNELEFYDFFSSSVKDGDLYQPPSLNIKIPGKVSINY